MAAHKTFDPRVYDDTKDTTEIESVVWSSKSVEWALDAIKLGQKIKRSPFYEKNIDLRQGNLVFQYSDYEIQELIKCAGNVMYFIEKYGKIKRPDGKIGNIRLRKYQLKQIRDYLEHDENILGWSRQSGKTIGSALYILWAMIFNADKSTALLANKGGTSKEVLDKIKGIYKNLPFFMKPGIMGWNQGVMAFDNGCRIFTGPTTNDALNGKTCNILYIDEFAYVGRGKNKIEYQKDFLANSKPVLSSQKNSGLCKLIISSTPLAKEYFYQLFNDAFKGKNNMHASKVCWWEVPGLTLDWAKGEIASIGITKFRQQYEMSFDVHAETLLKSSSMRRLSKYKLEYKANIFDILSEYEEYLLMHPDVEIDQDNDVFMLSVDIAEGLGQDYSTIQIMRLGFDQELYKFQFEQVGLFACNTISIEDFAVITRELFTTLNPDYSKLLVESNTYGQYFFKCLNDNEVEAEIPYESICKFKRSADNETKYKGLRTNAAIKKIAVKSFKSLVDQDQMIILEDSTIKEIENFQKSPKGVYAATIGHDDKVTPLINFAYWVQLNENEYKFWVEEFCELNSIDYDPQFARTNKKMQDKDDDVSTLSSEVLEFLT